LLKAIRDDEGLVALLGRDVRPVKALVFMLSALLAGAAGSTYAHYVTFIDPTSFTVMESVTLLAMVIIGGMASTVGPLLGAGFLIVTTEALRFAGLPAAVAAPLRETVFGLLVVLAMLYRPQGLIGRYGLSS
jgi:branched-chain amino acid transport system permease protein